jgi:hypothetical protein
MQFKTWNERYKHQKNVYMAAKYTAGHEASGGMTMLVNYPCVTKANGLTLAIENYLLWSGHRCTRINVAGRVINGKHIFSSTRKGSADLSCTIFGRSVQIEIKIGKDRPSEHQLKEQALERSAGGVYEFIKDIHGFFSWYDSFLLTL